MHRHSGFTFFELVTCLSILAIVALLALPNLSSALDKSQSLTFTHLTQRLLASARSHAIDVEEFVTLCGVDESGTCVRENFSTFALFFDHDDDKAIGENDELIQYVELSKGPEIKLKASLGRQYIRFKKDGSSQQAASITYCSPRYATHAARVTVSMSGRVYAGKDRDGDGIVELVNGDPIRCDS